MPPYIPDRPPDLEAEISTVPADQGGRTHPFFSGYRPNHDFGLAEGLVDAIHDYFDGDEIPVGDSGRARMWIVFSEAVRGKLSEGQTFTVQEGRRVVGRGCVIRILNQEFERSN